MYFIFPNMLQYPIAMDPSQTWASPVAFVKSSLLCEVIRLVKSELGNALFGNKDIWKRLEVAAAESLRWAKICRGKPSPLDLCIGQRKSGNSCGLWKPLFLRHKKAAREKGEILILTGHSLGGLANLCQWLRCLSPISSSQLTRGALVGAVSSRVAVDGIGFSPPGLYYQVFGPRIFWLVDSRCTFFLYFFVMMPRQRLWLQVLKYHIKLTLVTSEVEGISQPEISS